MNAFLAKWLALMLGDMKKDVILLQGFENLISISQ